MSEPKTVQRGAKFKWERGQEGTAIGGEEEGSQEGEGQKGHNC